jgi:hypothetical protein
MAAGSMVGIPVKVDPRCTYRIRKAIDRLVRKGLDDFDLLEFSAAVRNLQSAIDLGKKRHCGRSLEHARALLHMAIVHGRARRDYAKCVQYMEKALRANPNVSLPPNLPRSIVRMWKAARTLWGLDKQGSSPGRQP